jgi:uncharacterized UBP type Zn finger protein
MRKTKQMMYSVLLQSIIQMILQSIIQMILQSIIQMILQSIIQNNFSHKKCVAIDKEECFCFHGSPSFCKNRGEIALTTKSRCDMKTETYLFINNDAQPLRDSFFQCMNGGGVAWPAGRGAMSHVAWIILA